MLLSPRAISCTYSTKVVELESMNFKKMSDM